MPKKKQHGGILAIDPSFRGMGFALWCPGLSYTRTGHKDITENYKSYSRYDIIVKLASLYVEELFTAHFGIMEEVTVLVIESQFKTKLERLQDALVNQLYCRFALLGTHLKVITVAAYTWRAHYGLGAKQYRDRKELSVEFVSSNPQLIAWSKDLKDDNECEAIILLNYACAKHSLSFVSSVLFLPLQKMSMPCTVCSVQCNAATSNSEKNPGKAYWACKNPDCPGGEGKGKGFICWIGEEASAGKKPKYPVKKTTTTLQKRTSSAQTAPPAPKRVKTETDYLKMMTDTLQDILTQQLETNKLLTVLNANIPKSLEGVSDYYCDEQLTQPCDEEEE